MSMRAKACRWTLVAHFCVAMVTSIPLLLFAGRWAGWVDWRPLDPTALKLLGAALFALGIGSLLAARDPFRHRVIVQTELVFTLVAAAGLLYRELRFPKATPDIGWAFCAVVAVFFVLFAAFYPRAKDAA